ncbi:MAG: 50S ribosomal protein L1 [Candidatus Edwardsbacteria bacterium]|jgi:large subunit ribosomal protein L1|nr:50S ribosomal protein L1 [Candidatus Edwardsbacteria bacterium]
MHQGKKYTNSATKVDGNKSYPLKEAMAMVKDMAYAKFDETVELSLNLGVDPKQSDQNLRGTILLPHGSGKKVRVLVFAKGEKENEAKAAGADFTGADELIKKVSEGWTDFDVAIATPDMMAQVGKLGKILGVRGLMPNPKTGTVTFDVAKAVKDYKAGKLEYRVDKNSNMHLPIGKKSFDADKLYDNAVAAIAEVVRAKPSSVKGTYIKTLAVSSTMSPSVKIALSELATLGK